MSSLSVEESTSLADSLGKLLQDRYDFARSRAEQLAAPRECLPPIWSSLVELGLTALIVPEAQGGFGGGVADLQRVQRELGRSLVVSPFPGSALCARALVLVGTAAQQGMWLPKVADGSIVIALAETEEPALDAGLAPTRVRLSDNGWRLDGRKATVLHAEAATHYLVAAKLPEGGTAWFVVDAQQAGIHRRSYRLVDNAWAADVIFDGARGEKLGGDSLQHAVVSGDLRSWAIASYCAEALGAGEAALAMTVQYLRTRKQFGQPLGDYQALRHRVAEMHIALEQARSAAEMAREAASGGSADREVRAAQAQLVASEALTWLLQQAIQLHGGMGMTEELAIGHYYRRILVINALTGGASSALARLMEA